MINSKDLLEKCDDLIMRNKELENTLKDSVEKILSEHKQNDGYIAYMTIKDSLEHLLIQVCFEYQNQINKGGNK